MKTAKLKENNGFAIVSVVFLLFVLSLMGTAMFMYSVTSLRSVRYLSDRKKAEYLAQAGVEAASYAYQLAVKSNESTAGQLIAGTSADGSIIDSNRVYLVYTTAQGYQYVGSQADGTCSGSYSDDEIMGYYEVQIESKPNNRVEKSIQNSAVENNLQNGGSNGQGFKQYLVEINEGQRVFTAVGHTYGSNATATKKAYIAEPAQALNTYYDMNTGIIDGSIGSRTKTLTYTYEENGTVKTETQTVPIANTEAFSVLGEYTTGSVLNVRIDLFKNIPILGQFIGISLEHGIPINQRRIPILMGYTSGNMVLNQPDSGTVKFKEGQDNMVALVGATNVFVNTNIDVTPTRTNFNTLFLKGNNIVINGDIEMYVYGFQKMKLFQNTANLITLFTKNYCLGNVVIGTPNPEKATNMDPVNNDDVYSSYTYKLQGEGSGSYVVDEKVKGYGKCGKVFFGGDVFVNVQIPNVGTYRYKAFSSGDTYYYDDNLPAYVGAPAGFGIDLFKYFIDFAIASGKYSDNVNERLGQIMALYYSSGGQQPVSYVTGVEDTNGKATGVIKYNAMRKIDMSKFSADTYASLVPPDPTDATALNWILA